MQAVLLTRPETDALETAAELEKMGYRVLSDPILSIEPRIWQEPEWEGVAGIIVTSKNALAGFTGHGIPKHKSFFIVGERTSQAVRKLGYVHVTGTVERSDDLPALLHLQYKPEMGPFVHLTAAHSRDLFYAPLEADGYQIIPVVVYEAVAATSFRPQTIDALKKGDVQAATFFSARSAEIFHVLARAAQVENKLKNMQAICLSHAVADSCNSGLWNAVHVAERPTQQHILECLAKHCR